jgi:hypothetical protein
MTRERRVASCARDETLTVGSKSNDVSVALCREALALIVPNERSKTLAHGEPRLAGHRDSSTIAG